MRLGFFGTPSIASYCLEELAKRFDVAFAVTGADKPSGRRLKLHPSPVKLMADSLHLPVYQPLNLRDPGFIESLKKSGADIFVIVAYGRIIPAEVFTLPRFQTINLHPSLLPRLRGAAPVEWSLIEGEAETGVTVQMINERLDAGDIILQEKIHVDENVTSGELYERALSVGVRLLAASIDLLGSGQAALVPQREEDATYCGKIDRETARLNWMQDSRRIHNLVRGLNPKPVAWTMFRGMTMKVWKTALVKEQISSCPPGHLHMLGKKRLLVGTGSGCVEILSIQPEAKKLMDGLSFINGYRPTDGERFTDPIIAEQGP
jgi:methionyl-tRNA formyltransferase